MTNVPTNRETKPEPSRPVPAVKPEIRPVPTIPTVVVPASQPVQPAKTIAAPAPLKLNGGMFADAKKG